MSFNVHKNGTISDIGVAVPCAVDVLNKASFNAVASSNPAPPLPPAYPEEKAFITITFYFNETPPQK